MRGFKIILRTLTLAAVIALLGGLLPAAQAQEAQGERVIRIGIMGDSSVDEYQGSDRRGGDFRSVTYNWLEQLVLKRGFYAGEWGRYDEPRRTGYAYNWARSAATAWTMIQRGQHTGLAEQVANGLIDVVVLAIGNHDFAPYYDDGYDPIYSGALDDTGVTEKIDRMFENIVLAVDTVQEAGPVPMVISTVGDFNFDPGMASEYPDDAGRARVSDTINRLNEKIVQLAADRGLGVYSYAATLQAVLGRIQDGKAIVGGVGIDIFSVGNNPLNGILGDSIHGGTVMEGLIANRYLEAINGLIEPDVALLSDEEILETAGLLGEGAALSVQGGNNPPDAVDDTFSALSGQTITIQVAELLANDSDPDGDPLTIVTATNPANGQVAPAEGQSAFTYTSNPGFTGVDTATYTVSDGRGGTDTASVTINVTG